jgi:hypothetical protein
MASRAGTFAFLSAVSLSLAAQGLPTLPRTKPWEGPEAELLLPLRPFMLDEDQFESRTPPFAYRGDKVSEADDLFLIEAGTIESNGLMVLADHMTYNFRSGVVTAEGHVRLEAPGLRLRCAKLSMDWRNRDGEAEFLELDLEPSWHLRSAKVAFARLRQWDFEAVELSPCPEEKPGWSARMSRLQIDLDGFATFNHFRLRLHELPTHIYLPWGAYPAQATRSSGLLPPSLGFNSTLGTSFRLPWYQVLGPTADITVAPEYYTKAGTLWNAEARWTPEPTHRGSFAGQSIEDRLIGEHRYRYAFKELWQREDGWQLAADVNQASDNLVEVDYGKGLGGLGGQNYDSSFYLGKAWTWGAVSVAGSEQRSFFLTSNEGDPFYSATTFPASLRRQTLPNLQVRFYPISLGPMYLDAALGGSSLAYRIEGTPASATTPGVPDASYRWGRWDGQVRLHGRLGQIGPFRLDTEGLVRSTTYTATLQSALFTTEGATNNTLLDPATNPAFDPFRVVGPSTRRDLGSAHLRFSGPQVGREFEHVSLLGYSGELKHVVEPFFGFTATSRFGDAGRLPRFDDLDWRPGVNGSASGEQSVEVGLKQHILGRGGSGSPFADLVRWNVSTRYHLFPVLLPDGRFKKGFASLDSDVDLEPNDTLRVSFRRSANLDQGGADSSLSADLKTRSGSLFSLSLFSTGLNRFLVRQQGIQLGGLQRFFDDRIRLEYNANYDWRNHLFATSTVALAYVEPCVAYSLRFTHVALPGVLNAGRREDRLDLTISLRSLGELVNFRK